MHRTVLGVYLHMANKIIADKWEVHREIGQGGQAQVFVVTRVGESTQQQYALKF